MNAAQKRYYASAKGKATVRAYLVAARAKPEYKRARFAYHIRNRYGVEVEDIARLYHAQDRKCPGCMFPLSLEAKGTHIDHCHETGKLRGLLCFLCNATLGNVKDSEATLFNLVKYLRRYSEI